MNIGEKSPTGVAGLGDTRITPAYRPRQVEKQAPCQAGCPNCGDIRGWIGTVAQRNKTGLSRHEAYEQAWRTIVDVNPFPSSLGRVCPHPCEEHCNRSELDEPLAINAMERFLGDYAIEQSLPLQAYGTEKQEEWIGVVGAGPSGLSFAYQMARRGYRVTVYEEKDEAGGMLRFGVPEFRLPRGVLDAEIRRIIELGVELELGVAIGRDISLEELRSRHAAIYLGIGAQLGRAIEIPGEQGASVWTGTDYLAAVNCGDPVDLGSRVIVAGGGNTAIDAARSALRAGAGVKILYRRSRAEMPAIAQEIDDALEEGAELIELATPVSVERNADGGLEAVTVCRMKLGDADESGRRRPIPINGSEFTLPADTLITAVAQVPDLQGFKSLGSQGAWLRTDADGVLADDLLAGGDLLGPGIAGNAIVQGRQAAERLHKQLKRTETNAAQADEKAPIGPERILFDSKPSSTAARSPSVAASERVSMGASEYLHTISEGQFLAEVERCFSCGSCFGCEQCSMFCTPGCFSRLEEVGPGMYFTLALDSCEECGKCIEVCPCGFLESY